MTILRVKALLVTQGDRVVVGNYIRYEYGVRLGLEWKGRLLYFGQGILNVDMGVKTLAIPGYHVKDGAMPLTFATDYWR